jgi:hypothetical protein
MISPASRIWARSARADADDFDTGPARAGSEPQYEGMQIDGSLWTQTAPQTEMLQNHTSWAELIPNFSQAGLDRLGPNAASALSVEWPGADIYSARTDGVAQNPSSAFALTCQQEARALMAMFEQVSCFQVRYAISACCTTGTLLVPLSAAQITNLAWVSDE